MTQRRIGPGVRRPASVIPGASVREALAYAVAAGTAAVLNDGTELCHAADVHRLRREVSVESMPIEDIMSPQAAC